MTRNLQIKHLMHRFGLSPTQAHLIAVLHFGGSSNA